MKVTFVNWGTAQCGGNRVLFEVANGLKAKGHDVEIVALEPFSGWMELKAPITIAKSPQQLTDIIPVSDVLVATWFATAYLVDQVKGRKGIPAYYCQHYETIFFQSEQERQEVAKTYDLPFNLIANSPWLQQMLKELHKRESTLIVPAVNQTVFQPKIRSFEKQKDEPFKILAFASPTLFKGFYDTVLPAFHMVSRYVGNAEFHIFGNPPAELPYPEAFTKKVICHKVPKDEDLAKLYQEMDMFVSGSYAESSPLPHLEAMASYCPVVCTTFGTEHYGSGLKRELPKRPRDLALDIIELTQTPDRLKEMAEQALKDVKPLTWEATVEANEKFLKGLVGE